MTSSDAALVAQLSSAVASGSGVDEALYDLLLALDGRAIGLWRALPESLRLLGFAAVEDMPADVQRSFRESTADISLSLTRFGIVSAAVQREPVVMRVEDADASMSGSPGWLVRFDSVSSLSVPIVRGERLVAVFAVSSRESFDPATAGGARLVAIADALEI